MMFGTRESFTYQLCTACGSLQISDIPDDLSRYYPQGYYAHEIPTVTLRQRIKRPLGMLRDALMLFTGEWAFRVLRALPAVGFRIATTGCGRFARPTSHETPELPTWGVGAGPCCVVCRRLAFRTSRASIPTCTVRHPETGFASSKRGLTR